MKRFSYIILITFLFHHCEDRNLTDIEKQQVDFQRGNSLKIKSSKVDICHFDEESNDWFILNISENATKGHLKHGDVLLTDNDGDGFVIEINECVPGGDCDDDDVLVNPSAEEICGNGIDDNCNGEVDEECGVEIGDEFQGGVVGYILQEGDRCFDPNVQHGFIISKIDLAESVRWDTYPRWRYLGGTSTDLCLGNSNTIGLSRKSRLPPVQLVNEYENEGYDDWFLPSLRELDEIMTNLNHTGMFVKDEYWTSSEYHISYAYVVFINASGGIGTGAQRTYRERRVRAVRFF